MTELEIRTLTPRDTSVVDALLAKSYPRLLKADYPPSVLVTAIPIISRARPELMASGTFCGVWDETALVGVGGWTPNRPRGEAEVRHVATDPDGVRRGVGRALMTHVFEAARAAGRRDMRCMSTRTAVPFYEAMGFRQVKEGRVTLGPGIEFPAVLMRRRI